MSNTRFSQSFIGSLLEQGLVVSCISTDQRIQKELHSLEHCKRRKDYLGLYDTALRYVTLLLLDEGYSLVNEKAHVTFEKIISQLTCSHFVDSKGVITTRHRLKYRGLPPNNNRMMDLLNITQQLHKAAESLGVLKIRSAVKR